MIDFSVPLPGSDDFLPFSVTRGPVLLAGSRHLAVDPVTARLLTGRLAGLGFSFMTGCAAGVDRSFREALASSDFSRKALVACAFRRRREAAQGLPCKVVVDPGLPARVALAKRTVWMATRCSLAVIFPASPCGPGSRLAFKTAISNNAPVFLVTRDRPAESPLYTIVESCFDGIITGYWCVPTANIMAARSHGRA